MPDGAGRTPRATPPPGAPAETVGEGRLAAEVVVHEVIIECPVVIEMVGGGLDAAVRAAVVSEALGQLREVLRHG